MFYINIENGKINGGSEIDNSRFWSENYFQVEVEESVYNSIMAAPGKYKYDQQTEEIIENPDYEQEQAQKEAERIAMLNLTAADVERAIYKAKGIDFDDVIALVEQYNQTDPMSETGESTSIDIKALKIELKANNFYRGNPYIDMVGTLLGLSKEQLDEFFETNDYTKLLTTPELTNKNNKIQK